MGIFVSHAPKWFVNGVVLRSQCAKGLQGTCALMLTAGLVFGGCRQRATPPLQWVGSWATSAQGTDEPQQVANVTIRQVVKLSLGGERVRLRLSNAFGTKPVTIASTQVALRDAGAKPHAVKFQQQVAVTIAPGKEVLSDEVDLAVPDGRELEISLLLPEATSLETEHSLGLATTYFSSPGDATARTTESTYLVTDVEVARRDGAQAIVMIGDSLIDGHGSTVDSNHRWSNLLAERLQSKAMPVGVLNEGIGGNRLLHDFVGTNVLGRFAHDALDKAGVKYVVVSIGNNDLGIPGAFDLANETVSVEELIRGHQQLVERAHAKGVKIYATTLTPTENVTMKGYASRENEEKRQALNLWLRSSHTYDAIIDLDALVRDPEHPTRISPTYDSHDHLHPNNLGYQAMADAVDLALFGASTSVGK